MKPQIKTEPEDIKPDTSQLTLPKIEEPEVKSVTQEVAMDTDIVDIKQEVKDETKEGS